MAHINLGNDYPGMRGLLAYNPEFAQPFSEMCEVIMQIGRASCRERV